MVDKHDLVSAVLKLSSEIGRVPTRNEFMKAGVGFKHSVTFHYGSYTTFLMAAGLGPEKPKKIDNSIFEVELESHLSKHVSEKKKKKTPYPKIASISDIHWPFSNNSLVDKFIKFCESVQPDYIVLNGDAWDMYSHGKFPRSHNVFTPKDEQNKSRKMNEDFWNKIRKACPKSKCYQLLGNHDLRPLKRIIESYPEAEDWVKEKIKSLFSFDGVTTIHDPRQELVINDIAIFHGYRTKLGDHRDNTLFNCINGHTHKGGTVFRQIRGQVLWELNSGFAGDPTAKGLTYTPQKISDWTAGFAYVDEWGPRFLPE